VLADGDAAAGVAAPVAVDTGVSAAGGLIKTGPEHEIPTNENAIAERPATLRILYFIFAFASGLVFRMRFKE
jgi:hypothetical protein